MNRLLLLLSFVLAGLFQACDKIEAPYGEGGVAPSVNSVTIDQGTITGSIIDYTVISATESDTSVLYADWYHVVSGDTAYASVIFTWNGQKSDSLTAFVTPAGPVNFNDTLAIAAGSPFGTLTFHYITDVSVTGSGTATVIVIIVSSQSVRKVLLVDFTGQQCTYCPRGARKATELEGIYGDQLVGMAIHAGSFAVPAASGTMYTYDFRTPEGTQIASDFGVSSYPNGAINFKKFNGNVLQQYPSWGGSVANLLALSPEATIKITPQYNSASRESSLDIETTFLKQFSGNYNLAVYLIEDSIVNWQKDYDANPKDNPNYVHRHTFRGSYNGVYGDLVATGPSAGSTFNKQYVLTINNAFEDHHCAVVAVIWDMANKEILQAEEVHLIP